MKEKNHLRVDSPDAVWFQNFTLFLVISHFETSSFNDVTIFSWLSPISSLHNLPSSFTPNFFIIVLFYKATLSIVNLSLYFLSRTLFNIDKFLIPRLSLLFSMQIIDLFTKWGIFSNDPSHRKSFWIFTSFEFTLLGITNKDVL